MHTWRVQFLESCSYLADDVTLGEGAFSPGPALWVGRREIAHFDDDRALDVRLTRPVISARRTELREDSRVRLRKGSSDWVELDLQSDEDLDWAKSMVAEAVAANRSAAAGLPPEGAELERRRRFH